MNAKTRRTAFTLVEMLMVIAIIGILAALLLVTVNAARNAAARGRVGMQINQLSTAMERFQQKYGAYPPTFGDGDCFANFPTPEQPDAQQIRVLRQFRKMFPRYNVGDWDTLRQTVADATRTFASEQLKYEFDGGLDINRLDAAESLVFWLGGLPYVTGPISGSPQFDKYGVELTRFSADPTNPLMRARPRDPTVPEPTNTKRTEPLFEFTGMSLVDRDNDGWPEVVPAMGSGQDDAPPLVYFDSAGYGQLPFYPTGAESESNDPSTSGQTMLDKVGDWGVAQPYVESYTPSSLMPVYAQKDKFQIVCAGFDNRFDDANPGTLTDLVNGVQGRWKVYQRAKYIALPSGNESTFNGGEFDNFTNFVNGTLDQFAE